MKVSSSYYDEIFQFKGQWDMPSCCGLRIIHSNGTTIVIVTELYQDNPGSSVTSAGKYLEEQICQDKNLDINIVRYIECTPDTNSKLSFYDEAYFEVDFDKDITERYRRLSKEEIKSMMG